MKIENLYYMPAHECTIGTIPAHYWLATNEAESRHCEMVGGTLSDNFAEYYAEQDDQAMMSA